VVPLCPLTAAPPLDGFTAVLGLLCWEASLFGSDCALIPVLLFCVEVSVLSGVVLLLFCVADVPVLLVLPALVPVWPSAYVTLNASSRIAM